MYDVYDTGGDWLFSAVPIFITIIFVIILSIVVFTFVNGAKEWKTNNQSPKLTVEAVLRSKRSKVHHKNHLNNDHNGHSTSTSSTTYFATFEFISGDRSEFRLSGKQYGLLAEGDAGHLTFQGTRFIDFTRLP